MSLTNSVRLVGGIGKDPVGVKLPSGITVTNFSVACEDSIKGKDGNWSKKSEWVNCICFGKTAEAIAKWVKKGSQIIVEGKLQNSSWEDKNGGGKRYKTEVYVEKWMFQNGGKKADASAGANAAPANDIDDQDGLPFQTNTGGETLLLRGIMTYKREENKTQPDLCLGCKTVSDRFCITKKVELMAQEKSNPYPEGGWCKYYENIYSV